jgi:hypothetical protein
MKEFRVVAKCGDKARAKTCTDRKVPQKGDYYGLGSKVGEVRVTDTKINDGNAVVMVEVTPAAFSHLTMAEGWSAVE